MPLLGKNYISPARPEPQNSPRSRPPGAIIDTVWHQVPGQTLVQALETLFGTIERECCQCSARIEPSNGESSPIIFYRPAQTFIFPTSAISNRQRRRTRCTPNLHQTSDILIEVHINEMVSIYFGFIASLSRIGTTNPPRPSKSTRHRPPGAVIDTFRHYADHRTSSKAPVC